MAFQLNDDELLISNQTWNKLQSNATKSGFRDGMSDGRDSNFQKSFDKGYQEGFRNGFNLGMYKGALSLTDEKLDKSLEKTMRGNCLICTDKSLEEKPLQELIKLQNESTKKILESQQLK